MIKKMKKKLITIGIVGMFLLMGVIAVPVLATKLTNNVNMNGDGTGNLTVGVNPFNKIDKRPDIKLYNEAQVEAWELTLEKKKLLNI